MSLPFLAPPEVLGLGSVIQLCAGSRSPACAEHELSLVHCACWCSVGGWQHGPSCSLLSGYELLGKQGSLYHLRGWPGSSMLSHSLLQPLAGTALQWTSLLGNTS